MTDQTESASELERWGIRWDSPMKPVCEAMSDGYWTPWHVASAAIRALEAKVREMEEGLKEMVVECSRQVAQTEYWRAQYDELRQHRDGHMPDCAGWDPASNTCGCGYLQGEAYRELRADRDRLAGEVGRLQQAIKRQAASARMGMDAATRIGANNVREAARLFAESQPAVIESERAANELLTDEVARLTSELAASEAARTREGLLHIGTRDDLARARVELAAARENEARYLWLREHGDFGCTEKDGYGGQQLRTGERLDTAVDAARRAGEGEA